MNLNSKLQNYTSILNTRDSIFLENKESILKKLEERHNINLSNFLMQQEEKMKSRLESLEEVKIEQYHIDQKLQKEIEYFENLNEKI